MTIFEIQGSNKNVWGKPHLKSNRLLLSSKRQNHFRSIQPQPWHVVTTDCKLVVCFNRICHLSMGQIKQKLDGIFVPWFVQTVYQIHSEYISYSPLRSELLGMLMKNKAPKVRTLSAIKHYLAITTQSPSKRTKQSVSYFNEASI